MSARRGTEPFELYRARSRRYRSQILQVKMRLKALAEIYTKHFFAPLCSLNFLSNFCQNFCKILRNSVNLATFLKIFSNFRKILAFFRKNVILELCKGVHCVDLGESFQTHIYLQNLASIQPRTSPLKFAASRDVTDPGRVAPVHLRGVGHRRTASGSSHGSWRFLATESQRHPA